MGLENDTPHLLAARNEIRNLIKDQQITHLFCHGYKAGLVGWWAARKAGIPVMAVSRGWTGECWKVRAYEALDKRMLRRMDRVICVSQAQADKVRQSGVPEARIAVIPNAIDTRRFDNPDRAYHQRLLQMFPDSIRSQITQVIGAAGRLSPEKGFDVLVQAFAQVVESRPDVGLVLFGEGSERQRLQSMLQELGLRTGSCWPVSPIAWINTCRISICSCSLPTPKDCPTYCWRLWPPAFRSWPRMSGGTEGGVRQW